MVATLTCIDISLSIVSRLLSLKKKPSNQIFQGITADQLKKALDGSSRELKEFIKDEFDQQALNIILANIDTVYSTVRNAMESASDSNTELLFATSAAEGLVNSLMIYQDNTTIGRGLQGYGFFFIASSMLLAVYLERVNRKLSTKATFNDELISLINHCYYIHSVWKPLHYQRYKGICVDLANKRKDYCEACFTKWCNTITIPVMPKSYHAFLISNNLVEKAKDPFKQIEPNKIARFENLSEEMKKKAREYYEKYHSKKEVVDGYEFKYEYYQNYGYVPIRKSIGWKPLKIIVYDNCNIKLFQKYVDMSADEFERFCTTNFTYSSVLRMAILERDKIATKEWHEIENQYIERALEVVDKWKELTFKYVRHNVIPRRKIDKNPPIKMDFEVEKTIKPVIKIERS